MLHLGEHAPNGWCVGHLRDATHAVETEPGMMLDGHGNFF